jgi:hypothetical protein
MRKCIFCGENLNEEGLCPNAAQHFKSMCLNCVHCECKNEHCICNNDENKQDAVNRIKASFDGGYEIKNITLEPLPLKDPTKKCKRHTINSELVISNLS